MGFLGFGVFTASYFVVLRVGWVFGVFAASYVVVLRVDGFFGVFAASYFIILRIGGVFGVFGFFAASYFIVLRIGGVFGATRSTNVLGVNTKFNHVVGSRSWTHAKQKKVWLNEISMLWT